MLEENKCPNCSSKIVNLKCDGGGTENYGCKTCGYRYYFGVDWGVSEPDFFSPIGYPIKWKIPPKKKDDKELQDGLKVVSDKKLLNKLKNAKIEMASTDDVEKYQKEIRVILKILGHPEALVSDESSVWDFLSHFGSKEENKEHNQEMLEKISCMLVLDIKSGDLLVDIAKRIRSQ